MIPGGSGYSVDIGAISGTPGLLVVLVDENQKILLWNGTAADLFGVPAAQALGQPVSDVAGVPRTVTGLGRESLAGVIAAAGGWSGSLLYQRQDGSEFLLQAAGLRVPLERGAGTLWISHLPGKDSDQQALGEALALAAAERRRLTMIAEAGKLFGSSLDLDVVLDLVVTKTAQPWVTAVSYACSTSRASSCCPPRRTATMPYVRRRSKIPSTGARCPYPAHLPRDRCEPVRRS